MINSRHSSRMILTATIGMALLLGTGRTSGERIDDPIPDLIWDPAGQSVRADRWA